MSEEFLAHHGIKDQKWYRRRFQNEDGSLTPAGRERYGEWHPGKRKPTKLTVSKENGGQKKYNIESEDGKAVGSITTTHQSDDALRVNWINVDKEHKREGYGTSAMDTLIEDAKKNGYKKVTVVIPTDSKDVQHMYERMGFNVSKEGLTMDEVADSITTLGNVVKLEYDLQHSDFLMHYGKGHDDNPPGRGSGRYPYGSGKRPMQDVRSKEDRLAAMRMRAVEKAFNESSKKDEDYGKILQKALDEASKHDPDLFKNKQEDVMDAHLLWLFDEYKKALPKKQVFVSGSSHTQTENDPYYRKELPKAIRDELDKLVADSSGIIVGDAPGIDRQVQDYLKTLNYENVSVYGPGKKLRYLANENWTARPIDAPEFEPGSPEWLAKKDIAMEKDATEGLAVILDEGAKATRNNIKRLQNDGKEVKVYELNKVSEELDHWVDNLLDEVKHIDEGGDYLEHYGKGHDDNPPGRGSGRYPYGSGERPFQRDPARRKVAGGSGNIVRRPKTGGLFSIFRKTTEAQPSTEEEAKAKSIADRITKAYKSNTSNFGMVRDIPELKSLAESAKVEKAYRKYTDADYERENYDKKDVVEYYRKMGADAEWEIDPNAKYAFDSKEQLRFLFIDDDLDQADFNSFNCYLVDKGIDPSDYAKDLHESRKEAIDAILPEVKSILGKYGETKINNSGETISEYTARAIFDEYDLSYGYKPRWGDGYADVTWLKLGDGQRYDAFVNFVRNYNAPDNPKPSGIPNPRYPWSVPPKNLAKANSDGERRPAEPRGSGLKTGVLDRLIRNRTEATKEVAKTAEAKEQERQIKEAQVKAEAAKKKRLEALAKAREVRKANIDKAAAEKAAKEAEEKRINDAIESGDPDKISKIMSKLSNEQQRDAITRINQTAQINSLAAQQRKAIADAEAARKAAEEAIKEANRPRTKAEIREQKFNEALAKVSKAADKLDKVRDSGEKFIKFYNLAAGVNNAFNDKLKLPKIDLGGGQKKDGDKNKDENKDKKDKQQNQNNGSNNQNKDKQQNQSNGDTYNTTRDSYNTSTRITTIVGLLLPRSSLELIMLSRIGKRGRLIRNRETSF